MTDTSTASAKKGRREGAKMEADWPHATAGSHRGIQQSEALGNKKRKARMTCKDHMKTYMEMGPSGSKFWIKVPRVAGARGVNHWDTRHDRR